MRTDATCVTGEFCALASHRSRRARGRVQQTGGDMKGSAEQLRTRREEPGENQRKTNNHGQRERGHLGGEAAEKGGR